jgi:hypothetical protein
MASIHRRVTCAGHVKSWAKVTLLTHFDHLFGQGLFQRFFLLAVHRPPNPLFYLETYMNIYGTQREGFEALKSYP